MDCVQHHGRQPRPDPGRRRRRAPPAAHRGPRQGESDHGKLFKLLHPCPRDKGNYTALGLHYYVVPDKIYY